MSEKPNKKRFLKVNIEISNICNLQCSFCPEVLRPKKLMEPALFESIIEQVAPLTEQVCLHVMGDPLVHPRLEELVAVCERANTRIFLVTNGVLLRERHQELLLHPVFRQICFSLHSFPDNFPGQDPGPYLERIFAFTERCFEKRPDLFLNYRLWNLSTPGGASAENQDILRRVEERFKTQLNLEALDVREEKAVKIGRRLSLHFDTEFTWPSMDLPVLGTRGTCYGLRNHFGILVDGTVVPCCLDKEAATPLGNIQTSRIEEILASPRAQAILTGFRNRQLVEPLCQRCPYIERFDRA